MFIECVRGVVVPALPGPPHLELTKLLHFYLLLPLNLNFHQVPSP